MQSIVAQISSVNVFYNQFARANIAATQRAIVIPVFNIEVHKAIKSNHDHSPDVHSSTIATDPSAELKLGQSCTISLILIISNDDVDLLYHLTQVAASVLMKNKRKCKSVLGNLGKDLNVHAASLKQQPFPKGNPPNVYRTFETQKIAHVKQNWTLSHHALRRCKATICLMPFHRIDQFERFSSLLFLEKTNEMRDDSDFKKCAEGVIEILKPALACFLNNLRRSLMSCPLYH